jgi:hypothetical protein
VSPNFDDLRRRMEEDELRDALELSPKMSVRDYARARGFKNAQSVYYHIKASHIKQVKCECGRWVLEVKEADEYFGFNKKEGNDDA